MAASVDGSVRCFDLRAGCVTADELRRPVTSLALSRDGNCLLAACLDSRLRLLDRGSGTLLAQYTSAPRASNPPCPPRLCPPHVVTRKPGGRLPHGLRPSIARVPALRSVLAVSRCTDALRLSNEIQGR